MINKYEITITAIVELNTEDFDEGVLDDEDNVEDIIIEMLADDLDKYVTAYKIQRKNEEG